MAQETLTYLALRDQAWKSLRLGALQRGPCPLYALLGTAGFGMFLVVMNVPPLAFAWLVSMLGISGWTAWQSVKDPAGRRKAIMSVVKRQFSIEDLPPATRHLHEALERGVTILGEIAVKITEIVRANQENSDLPRVFADAERMVSLQFESARHVASFQHTLYVVSGKTTGKKRETDALLLENVEILKQEIAKAENRIEEIGSRLNIVMVQLTQLELQPSDQIRISDLTSGSNRTVQELQIQVEAQRSVASELMQRLSA
ncbi:MAG: hypothetical protein Q7R79_03110 [bacterium]|nr:hypothetical protein [bacterium]